MFGDFSRLYIKELNKKLELFYKQTTWQFYVIYTLYIFGKTLMLFQQVKRFG